MCKLSQSGKCMDPNSLITLSCSGISEEKAVHFVEGCGVGVEKGHAVS
jgi:hypothetical protein